MKKRRGEWKEGERGKRKQRDDKSKARHRKTTFKSNTLYEFAIGLTASNSALDQTMVFVFVQRIVKKKHGLGK